MNRVTWKYPLKSRSELEKELRDDLVSFEDTRANLKVRHPEIVQQVRENGSVYYAIEVDDL